MLYIRILKLLIHRIYKYINFKEQEKSIFSTERKVNFGMSVLEHTKNVSYDIALSYEIIGLL